MKTVFLITALLLSIANPHKDIHVYFKYVGQTVTEAEIEEILGEGYTQDRTSFSKDGVKIRLDDYMYKRSTPVMEIEEIWLSNAFLSSKANKADPFLGLTLKMTREECVAHLESLDHFKQVTAGSDMYGENIKAYYTGNPNAPSYNGLFVFMRFEKGKKKKLYLSSITIKDRGKI